MSLRAALQRHLVSPPYNRQLNIITDGDFQGVNSLLAGLVKRQKKKGEDVSKKHEPISEDDLKLMYASGVLSDVSPTNLQLKIFFELTLHFGRRGREGLRELKKDDIVFRKDPSGTEYATLGFNPSKKNHQGISHHISEHDQKMFATNCDDCPVQSLNFYLSKLHPDCPYLFQLPRTDKATGSTVWYCKKASGVNAIGGFMAKISDEAQLSKRYTNHCIRATTVTQLRDGGMDPQDIVSVTGHRCVNSISSYSNTNVSKRKEMSHALSKAIGKETKKSPPKGGLKNVIPKPTTPVQVVKPISQTVSPCVSPQYASPRRSPRIAEKEAAKVRNQGKIGKKLEFCEPIPSPAIVQQQDQKGHPTIIVNGGVVNFYYK